MTVTAREFLAMAIGQFASTKDPMKSLVMITDIGKKLMMTPQEVAEVFLGISEMCFKTVRMKEWMKPLYTKGDKERTEFEKYFEDVLRFCYEGRKK